MGRLKNGYKEFNRAILAGLEAEAKIVVTHEDSGISWAGFWIGLGIFLAAGLLAGQVVLK